MTIIESRAGTSTRPGTIGDSVARPDGVAKTQGSFSFSNISVGASQRGSLG